MLFLKVFALVSVFLSALAVTACGGSSDPEGDEVVWRKGEPVVVVHRGPLPKKLVVKRLRPGSGATLTAGSTGTFRYKNFDYRTGQRYEDWWTGPPFLTEFGTGVSLPAWETGLRGMRVGERRELIVPAKQAYGHIPEIYVIQLNAVTPPERKKGLRKITGAVKAPRIQIPPGGPPKGLVVRKLKPGSGRGAEVGDRLGVRYIGINYSTKHVFDVWNERTRYSFVLGEGQVRKGWEIALKGMKLGERLELRLPSRLAYGKGAMVYVIELVEMERLKPYLKRCKVHVEHVICPHR